MGISQEVSCRAPNLSPGFNTWFGHVGRTKFLSVSPHKSFTSLPGGSYVACWTEFIPHCWYGYTGAYVEQMFHPVPYMPVTSLLCSSPCLSGSCLCISVSVVKLSHPSLFTMGPACLWTSSSAKVTLNSIINPSVHT